MQERSDPGGATEAGGIVPAERLYRPADLSGLSFETTAELEPIEGVIGQERALDAIRFGAGIDKSGFNLFAIGRSEAGIRQAVQAVLGDMAPMRTRPGDWVYVNNFADARRPAAIALPAGQAPVFQAAMHELIVDLKAAIPAAFESEQYQTQRGAIEQTFQTLQGDAFGALQEKASEKDFALLRTPVGFSLLPARKGQVVPPEEFNAWPAAEREAIEANALALREDVEKFLRQIPKWEKNRRDAVRDLNRQTAETAVGHLIEEQKSKFTQNPAILDHLARVRTDLVDNIDMFTGGETGPGADMMLGGPFDRYEVNVLVSQAAGAAAPVVEEPHPTLGNLTGSIEHMAQQGVLITNFRLIKAGALHQANGGYLILDARNLLSEPFSWPALKRVLRSRQIVIEDVTRLVGLSSTVTLEPDPIPLDVKIVLHGDRLLYFLLSALDPELGEHFKVLADFDDDLDRSPQSEAILARVIAGLVRRDGLKPLDRGAVAAVIEHAARLAEDSGKLTALVDQIRDVLAEADFWSKQAGATTIARDQVERAIAERVRRAARLRDRMQESTLKDIALIRTTGASVGQINGLSVIALGGFAFGRPTRISCRVRPGGGRVVDIEREVELGGPIHSKGVLILSGFLGGRYALDAPMSVQASLVFEQSYSGVEGDSASSAELYVLLSALAELPLRQDLAVTGSVNQHGEVQAIGGVNEKIEGFFDLCAARGLTGDQGVIIPQANVQHLMLRQEVIEACAAGRFTIHAVSRIDEGLALLTGRAAGERAADGRYPPDSVNRLVEDRLHAFAEIRRAFAAEADAAEAGSKARDLRAAAKPVN